jgi:hypothetical protein
LDFRVQILNAVRTEIKQPRIADLTLNEEFSIKMPSAQRTGFCIELVRSWRLSYDNAITIVNGDEQKNDEGDCEESKHMISSSFGFLNIILRF